MATTIPEGFAQAAWITEGQYGTGPFVFTMGLGIASGGPDLVAIANQCHAAYKYAFQSPMSNGLTGQKVTLTVNVGGALGSVDSDDPPFTGQRSADDDPIALALLVNKRTALLGRRGRGRMFVPGVLAGDDTGLGGEYTTSARESFQERCDDFLEYLIGNTPGMVDPLELLPCVLHSDDTTPTPISSLVLNRKVGVLRKRLR